MQQSSDMLTFPKSANVTPFKLEPENYYLFDLTRKNEALREIDFNDRHGFDEYIFQKLENEKKAFGIGRYNEDRVIYNTDVFSGEERRSIHLGIDIWAPAGTPVFAPYRGRVHSVANNSSQGDYGPTVILEHTLDEATFYTLYGHLTITDLDHLSPGDHIQEGECFAHYGTYEENVHYPPHLHFQVILDIGNAAGDFPGVCKPSERQIWINRCPDPNLILQIPGIR